MVMSNSIPCASNIISRFNNATKLHFRIDQSEFHLERSDSVSAI
jgi:hypothetical protein